MEELHDIKRINGSTDRIGVLWVPGNTHSITSEWTLIQCIILESKISKIPGWHCSHLYSFSGGFLHTTLHISLTALWNKPKRLPKQKSFCATNWREGGKNSLNKHIAIQRQEQREEASPKCGMQTPTYILMNWKMLYSTEDFSNKAPVARIWKARPWSTQWKKRKECPGDSQCSSPDSKRGY